MSDLQCPATFHVFGPEASPTNAVSVHGAPVVAVHAAGVRLREHADAEPLGDGDLDTVLESLADLYRGVHVVVLTDVVEPPLRHPADVVIVRVDADGHAVTRPGAEGD